MSAQKIIRPSIAARLVSWVPPAVCLAVFCQLYVNGYLPATEKSRRLEREEATMQTRSERLGEETRLLEEQRRMLADEIYRERVRRTLHDPHQKTLTLERARALAHREAELEDL